MPMRKATITRRSVLGKYLRFLIMISKELFGFELCISLPSRPSSAIWSFLRNSKMMLAVLYKIQANSAGKIDPVHPKNWIFFKSFRLLFPRKLILLLVPLQRTVARRFESGIEGFFDKALLEIREASTARKLFLAWVKDLRWWPVLSHNTGQNSSTIWWGETFRLR